MPYVGENWKDTDASTKRPYTYDFSQRIPPDDEISAVTWELTVAPTSVYTVVDPAPQSHVSAPGFSSTLASCWLDGLLGNCRYKLTAFVTTAAGVKDDLYSYIQCSPRP